MRNVRITKISDSYLPRYPINIFVGFIYEGYAPHELTINEIFIVGIFHTSRVQKINEDGTFETQNSIYKLEELS